MTDVGSVSVVNLSTDLSSPSAPPSSTPPSASPTVAPSASPIVIASASADCPADGDPGRVAAADGASSAPPSAAPASASPSPSPSVVVTPSPDGGSVEIAHDVVVVGQSAAYSASAVGSPSAPAPSTARPGRTSISGSSATPRPAVTLDHRSVFGSWSGDTIVASTVADAAGGALDPVSFALDPSSSVTTTLPQTGRAWRPAVDPTGRKAVYWSGSLRSIDGPASRQTPAASSWATGIDTSDALASARPTPLAGDQAKDRNETTIAAGRLDDWDARWAAPGPISPLDRRPADPGIGRLSLYAVDAFEARSPEDAAPRRPPRDRRLLISDGQLVGRGAADGSAAATGSSSLASTEDGVGTVETVTGQVDPRSADGRIPVDAPRSRRGPVSKSDHDLGDARPRRAPHGEEVRPVPSTIPPRPTFAPGGVVVTAPGSPAARRWSRSCPRGRGAWRSCRCRRRCALAGHRDERGGFKALPPSAAGTGQPAGLGSPAGAPCRARSGGSMRRWAPAGADPSVEQSAATRSMRRGTWTDWNVAGASGRRVAATCVPGSAPRARRGGDAAPRRPFQHLVAPRIYNHRDGPSTPRSAPDPTSAFSSPRVMLRS